MTGSETRRRFLEHFASREHRILPSAPLVPQRDPTTLFISAGMHPLKPYFQGVSKPPAPRLASCQKCFRTPDLEEVGKTDRHNTFFEMLGNFTPTGDYFKAGAIALAWELVTESFQLPKSKLRVTVHPDDEESPALWRRETDVRPDWIYPNADNWWYAGATGPNGPDSELWFDRGPEVGCGKPDCIPDHCERFLEFWNLVFMQYDTQAGGARVPLPKPGVDTGMGLERMASILQGKDNIFEIDLFKSLLDFIHAQSQQRSTVSERVVADHLRGMTFVIADGVLPSNEGRGYVLRRLIRRATLHAGHLGLRNLADGVGVVVETMQDQYPELAAREQLVRDVVGQEAKKFRQTLEQGMELFERVLASHPKVIPGDEAFRLHDTFGFPIELTRELAAERQGEVDLEGFERSMAAQRERSRTMTGDRWPDVQALPRGSQFVGYEEHSKQSALIGLRRAGANVNQLFEGDDGEVFLRYTPFYAEAGGQIGDMGQLVGPTGVFRVDDTQSPAPGVISHIGTQVMGTLHSQNNVLAEVDTDRRIQIARHHSATHLLHKALREILGEHAIQKGSWVGPDHTTFDFSLNRPMTRDEIELTNRRINQQIRAGLPVEATFKSYDEAIADGAMHLFEEKYGDQVRVVCFGDWTCELCGGTHVKNSADVGPAVILSESSVGAGLRRIDLVAGEAAESVLRQRLSALAETARLLKTKPERLHERVLDLTRTLKKLERQTDDLEKRLARADVQLARARAESKASKPPEQQDSRDRKAQQDLQGVEFDDEAIADIRERAVTVHKSRYGPVITEQVKANDLEGLRRYVDSYFEVLGAEPGVVAVTNGREFVIKVSKALEGKLDLGVLARTLGEGGGRGRLAQGKLGGPWIEARDAFLETLGPAK